jgi:hypothetical protein
MKPTAVVPIPPRLARRPRDARGYPIPYGVLIRKDGTPDFRVVDLERWQHAVQHRRCGLCGEPLGAHLAFVGGPLCEANRVFLDLPMHRDCAEYALQVCPYLALPKTAFVDTAKVDTEGHTLHVSTDVAEDKPERFWLGIAKGYAVVQLPGSSYGLQATPWVGGEWWQDGKPVDRAGG